ADVVLKRMHEFVTDDVIGVSERAGKREHDPPPQPLGHAAGAFTYFASDDVGLLELDVRAIQNERLQSAELMVQQTLETHPPPFGKARGDLNTLLLARVEIDVEVLSLEDLEIEVSILNLVASEVLC